MTGATPTLELTPDVRQLLAQRDIAGLYTALQRAGVSQRRIAALTGQAQSEISEILAGRQVRSIPVLERIVDGLGIPRITVGLVDASPSNEPLSVPTLTARPRRPAQPPRPPRAPRPGRRVVVGPHGPDVPLWTATEIWSLRQAMRMTTNELAAHLGVASRAVSRWEAGAIPSPFDQTLLDTALKQATPTVQSRFVLLMSPERIPANGWPTNSPGCAPRANTAG